MQDNSFALYSVSACLTGIFCNIVTNPFWVLRTRMQAEIFRNGKQEHYERMYKGIANSLLKVYKEEGGKALFSGLSASMFGIAHPLIYFPLYEKSKIYCK